MTYDTKIAVVVRADLAPWQKLNVTAFLAGGLAGTHPEIVGERYADGSGRGYASLIRQPVLVFAATADELARTLGRAHGRNLQPAVYTDDLFATSNDADNRAAVAAVPTEALPLAGLGLHAERRIVDKVVKGLRLHE